jgi:uncharacterized protein YbjT (DUF2867 family)/membrane protease YdiL (CAAX protease family)
MARRASEFVTARDHSRFPAPAQVKVGPDSDSMSPMPERSVLLTGASGFVGGAVRPALEATGWRVRCLTRDAARARTLAPKLDWVQGDVGDSISLARALDGCQAALYLVHGIGEGPGYHAQEVVAATTFARAAAAAGVARIVYLGGVAPSGQGSEHLRSRRDVGEALRSGPVKTVELRASMIVGHGSLSWLIVRDLAARLPVMVLPRWLKSRTEPVAIDDVVIALVRALDLPLEASAWFDVPGPEVLSGKEILEETSRALGLRHPRMIGVPLLTPRLSSLWVRFVTRARWSVAREVVVGLTEDLLAQDDRYWRLIDHPRRLPFAEAARRALEAERQDGPVRGVWGAIERARTGRAPSDSRDRPAVPKSKDTLALVCVLAWFAAAAGTRTLGIWPAAGGAALVLGIAVLLRDGAAARTLLRPSLQRILLGAVAGGAMAAVTYLLYPVLALLAPSLAGDTALLYSAFRAPSLLIASLALLPVILGEELIWRGVVQTALAQRLGTAGGVALAAGTYALAIAPLGPGVLVLVALACGLFWGTLRAATGSLVPPLVAHLVWDVLVLVLLPLDSR